MELHICRPTGNLLGDALPYPLGVDSCSAYLALWRRKVIFDVAILQRVGEQYISHF